MHGSLQWTGGHSCEGIVPRVQLGKKRMETTDLRFSSCFGIFLILAKIGIENTALIGLKSGLILYNDPVFNNRPFLRAF